MRKQNYAHGWFVQQHWCGCLESDSDSHQWRLNCENHWGNLERRGKPKSKEVMAVKTHWDCDKPALSFALALAVGGGGGRVERDATGAAAAAWLTVLVDSWHFMIIREHRDLNIAWHTVEQLKAVLGSARWVSSWTALSSRGIGVKVSPKGDI
jgi:hypothetical protein